MSLQSFNDVATMSNQEIEKKIGEIYRKIGTLPHGSWEEEDKYLRVVFALKQTLRLRRL